MIQLRVESVLIELRRDAAFRQRRSTQAASEIAMSSSVSDFSPGSFTGTLDSPRSKNSPHDLDASTTSATFDDLSDRSWDGVVELCSAITAPVTVDISNEESDGGQGLSRNFSSSYISPNRRSHTMVATAMDPAASLHLFSSGSNATLMTLTSLREQLCRFSLMAIIRRTEPGLELSTSSFGKTIVASGRLDLETLRYASRKEASYTVTAALTFETAIVGNVTLSLSML